jgi:3-mercaptopyruvate sulfurtransferase SseA
MGGIIGMLVVGLMLVVFLLVTNRNNTTPPVVQSSGTPLATAPASANDPPRMSLADFKALYDDPAKRPMIIDVRAEASFQEGHIAGAVSFPEADVDTRVNEIPKDKLVVAYCQ